MEIIVLPQALPQHSEQTIELHHYQNGQDIQRTKIRLSKHTISFLRMGTKEVIGDDRTTQIDPKQFIVMKSGNCLMTEKVSSTDQQYKSILLFFSDELAMDFLARNQLYAPPRTPSQSFYVFPYDDFIHHYVTSLEKILLLPKKAREKLLKAKFEEIMLYLTHQHGPSFLNRIVQQVDHTLTRLNTVVESNRYNKLSLQELAFLANMSVSTFKREFYKQYEKTPMKWFSEERLERVAQLLKTKRKRPVELYEAAGYESFSNFVQAFKKQFGQTPKQYQNQE
ncbi:MAG: AraC family transcriptional regulator [Bacteroidota bacterium]